MMKRRIATLTLIMSTTSAIAAAKPFTCETQISKDSQKTLTMTITGEFNHSKVLPSGYISGSGPLHVIVTESINGISSAHFSRHFKHAYYESGEDGFAGTATGFNGKTYDIHLIPNGTQGEAGPTKKSLNISSDDPAFGQLLNQNSAPYIFHDIPCEK